MREHLSRCTIPLNLKKSSTPLPMDTPSPRSSGSINLKPSSPSPADSRHVSASPGHAVGMQVRWEDVCTFVCWAVVFFFFLIAVTLTFGHSLASSYAKGVIFVHFLFPFLDVLACLWKKYWEMGTQLLSLFSATWKPLCSSFK